MENELEDALAELAALREEFAKERRPVYETLGNPSFSTSGMPPSRYLCTKCMRSFAVSDETCPICALTARAVRAEADAKRLDWVLDNCYVEIARRDGDRLLNDRADVDAQMAIDAARAPRPATP